MLWISTRKVVQHTHGSFSSWSEDHHDLRKVTQILLEYDLLALGLKGLMYLAMYHFQTHPRVVKWFDNT